MCRSIFNFRGNKDGGRWLRIIVEEAVGVVKATVWDSVIELSWVSPNLVLIMMGNAMYLCLYILIDYMKFSDYSRNIKFC